MDNCIMIVLSAGSGDRPDAYLVRVHRGRSVEVENGRGGSTSIVLNEIATNLPDALALAALLWDHAGKRLEEPDA